MTVDSIQITAEQYDQLETVLCNVNKKTPLTERFRALFSLKSVATPQAIDIIGRAFADPSALLKHELAYVLGQIKNSYAISKLVPVLENRDEHPMVRHEAAEALGAIGDPSAIPVLQTFLKDDSIEVRETCEIALDKLRFESTDQGQNVPHARFSSVDPAPGFVDEALPTVDELRHLLLDTRKPLFERYRAMFSLRNGGSEQCIAALADGLTYTEPSEGGSALFRHEIAYIFGQLQHPASVPALIRCLANAKEEGMVRHEAAEALGSIATPEAVKALQCHLNDPESVVRESCLVGLDMSEYEQSHELHYANALSKTTTS
ncbi:hypothetical protein CXG81DRAFT_8636 [Caulochytrium protostelioides]|uniref:Deoxyhypusine hydroxylase n=1 Tax=Caulochytrium protostelioides TaxID=1555241 RepID=A0A4P9XEX0_9FUNG|nr:deoxyhypusine hydroxylase [Caulochytrium protostelioides]RKP04104.1 hypothetical protein CXG81DRAFT_8636 [Caulochytrium protostelioides]|eukprot:RKP04104.1 hypothetical protein CXG81DRAFT_8636 [Caulochytrium protostelioides]